MAEPSGRDADLSPQERLFAVEVARARAAAKVSQAWVGERIGLSRSKVSEVCCGRYLPAREAVVLLSEVLGMDRERTLCLWQDARDASDQRRHRKRLDRLATDPAGWDRLPVLPTEVVSLLRAQVREAEEMPYRLPGARRPSLSTVYVRQELGSEPEDALPVRQPAMAPRPPAGDSFGDHQFERSDRMPTPARVSGPRLTMRAPSRPVREALDANDHVLVTAGPGQGKSTLTLRLAADIATAWVGRDDSAETVTEGDPPLDEVVIPVRLPARVLAARSDLPLPEALADAVSAAYGSMLTQSTPPATFAERIAGCRWLLLVDAVDEIADPQARARFVRTLSSWASASPGRPYRLLVTSRPLESGGLAPLHRDAARYELQPFDASTLRRFASNWFNGEDDGRRFLDQIRQAHLDELVRVPLLATIAAIIFEEHGERPLPDNRYSLYEEYLNYLASARRWPDEIGPFARLVRELLPRLLEHLGSTRFQADVSLTASAQTWILANSTPPQRPAAWQADLTALLRTVGPLVVRGDDLQFLHHSFADHLAASASARLLSMPFDADHPDWAGAIHAAQHGLSTRHARTVLLHYTHLRAEQADRLISWLHDNSSGFQLIAAELLSQHAPVTSVVLDAFLDTARAWAKTSSGTEIFRQATHATHHPRLATWLRDLMHDPEAQWDCRIEAAVALCNRLRSDVDEAAGLLRSAMADGSLGLADRLAAAEGLAKVGPNQRAAAEAGLRAVLDDPGRTAFTLRGAAVALADLGRECHRDAIALLRETLADTGVPWEHHLQAAVGLAEIDAEFHPEAVATLNELIADTSVSTYQRGQAALALGDLRSVYLEQAADLLHRMIDDRRHTATERSRFAATLAELGPEYVTQAADHLLGILDEPFVHPQERANVAADLAKAHPGHRPMIADQLRRVISDPAIFAGSKFEAAKVFADLGTDYHEEAATTLLQLSENPFSFHFFRAELAGKVAEIGPRYRDMAVTRLRRKLTDHAVDAEERIAAATWLIDIGTEFHDEAAAALRTIATDPAETDIDRLTAASTLVGVQNTFQRQAIEIIRTILRNHGAYTHARVMAARHLARLRPGLREESAAVLRVVMLDNACDWSRRTSAARFLADLGQEHTRDAAAGLCAMLDRPPPESGSHRQVVLALVGLGTEFKDNAAEALRMALVKPTAPDRTRAAALALAELGDEHWDTAERALHTVLSDPDAPAETLREAAELLIRQNSRHRVLAETTMRAVVANPLATTWIRELTAKTMARLGGRQLIEAIDALTAAVVGPSKSVQSRAQLAGTLATLGDAPRELARTALQAMLAETRTPGDRLEVTWQLMVIDPAYRDEGKACLSAAVVDPAVPATDRCTAAEKLVMLDQNAVRDMAPLLRTMLTSPLTTPADRLNIADSLSNIGALNRAAWFTTALAVTLDPTASGTTRGRATRRMRTTPHIQPTTSREIEREILGDHLVPVRERFLTRPNLHPGDGPLREERIAALREIMAEPEFDTKDRLAAWHVLAEFGQEFAQEAACALQAIIDDADASVAAVGQALSALSRLGAAHRRRARTLAEKILSNPVTPPQQRLETAVASASFSGPARSILVTALHDGGAGTRIRAATTLAWYGSAEAMALLQEMARDVALLPYLRREAAVTVAEVIPAERSAMADILDELAGPTTSPPARCRIAADLARLGESYRERATAHLQKIMADHDIPASARIEAAKVLVATHPRHLTEAADTLRAIAGAPVRHATRLHALSTLGTFTRPHCDEAVAALRTDLTDPTKPATVRWRAARAMVRLRRDTTTETALVVHQVIRSADTPPHVRRRAAQALARWSPPHRDVARLVLRTHSLSPPD